MNDGCEDLGAQAIELIGVDEIEGVAQSPNHAGAGRTTKPGLSCNRDLECSFKCRKGGFCNERLGNCECLLY